MKPPTLIIFLCSLLFTSAPAYALPVEHLMRALQERGAAINQNLVNEGLSAYSSWPIDWDDLGGLIGESSVPDYPENGFFDAIYLDENYEDILVQIVTRLYNETKLMAPYFIFVPPGSVSEVLHGAGDFPEPYSMLENDIFDGSLTIDISNYVVAFQSISERICDYKYMYLANGGELGYYWMGDSLVDGYPPTYGGCSFPIDTENEYHFYFEFLAWTYFLVNYKEVRFIDDFVDNTLLTFWEADFDVYYGKIKPLQTNLNGQVSRLLKYTGPDELEFDLLAEISGIESIQDYNVVQVDSDLQELTMTGPVSFESVTLPPMGTNQPSWTLCGRIGTVRLDVRYLIELEFEEDCDPCATCEDCDFGGLALNRNSPGFGFQFGNSPGKISMSGPMPSPSLVSPDILVVTPEEFAVYDNDDLIRAESPTTYVEFGIITNGYTMDLYHGAFPNGTLMKTVSVSSPDPNATDGFELYIDDAGKVSGYIYNEAANRWDFVEGAGDELRQTKTVRGSLLDSNDAVIGTYSETSVFNADDTLVSKTRSERTQFPFGLKPTREIIAPGEPEEYWTEYTYYDDDGDPGDGDNYGRLKSTADSNGNWTEYLEYDEYGRVLKEVRQLGNGTDATWKGNNLSYETDYAPGLTTRREYEDGQLVRLEWTERPSLDITRHIVATDTGASGPEDSDNLVTTTRTYLAGPGRQKTHYVVYPDGTALINVYSKDEQTGHTTHVASRGVPDSTSEPTAITAGTATETERDNKERIVFREVKDIASGIVTDREIYSDPDNLGRYREITYLNNLSSLRQYTCCGVASETDVNGVTRVYGRDSQGRRNETRRYFASALTGGSKQVLDAMNRVVEEIQIADDESERVVAENEYDLRGRVVTTKDALGRETTFTFTEENGYLVTTESRPDGGQIITRNYQDGRVYERVGSALIASMRYTYGTTTAGERTVLETLLDPMGDPTAEYTLTVTDIAGRIIRVERPNPEPEATSPAVKHYEYNSLGQLRSVTDADAIETRYGYNALGRRSSVRVDPEGLDIITTTEITFEDHAIVGDARVTATLRGDDPDDTVFAVEATDRLTRATILDGKATVTAIEHNTGGFTRRETTTFPNGTSEVLSFNGAGLLASRHLRDIHGTPLESTTRTYNKWGDLEEEQNPETGLTVFEFYPDGNPKKITVAGTLITEWEYFDEEPGYRIEVTLPGNSMSIDHLLPNGLLHRRHGSNQYPVEFAYDPAGRIASMRTWREFSGWGSGYDETLWHYNNAGLLESKEYSNGLGPSYTYTAASRPHTRTWARDVTTTTTYHPAGLPHITSYSDATPTVTRGYNRAGRLTSVTDATGTHALTYTPDGQLDTQTTTGGILDGLSLTNAYTAHGQREDLLLGHGTSNLLHHHYTYDSDTGRLDTAAVLNPITETILGQATYSYWPNTRHIHTRTFDSGSTMLLTTTTTYDSLHRIDTITAEDAGLDILLSLDYFHDSRGRRDRIDREDGTYWSYAYNDRNEVLSGIKRFANDTLIPGHHFDYAFDNIGNRTEIEREGIVYNYEANNLNQLTERDVPTDYVITGTADSQAEILVNGQAAARIGDFWSRTLTVDNSTHPAYLPVSVEGLLYGAGPNGETVQATADAGLLLVPQTPEVPVYDEDGNLIEDGLRSYTWDAENRLIVVEPRSDFIGIHTIPKVEFTYDYRGRRTLKKVYTWEAFEAQWELARTERFLYDDWNMVAILNDEDELSQSFLWGTDLSGTLQGAGGVGGLLAVLEHTDTAIDVHFAISDANGNVIGLFDATTEELSAEYDYGPFGEPVKAVGPMAEVNPFRFSTKYWDADTQLLSYQLRDYSITWARWTTRDPIGEQGGLNLYGFVGNNPSNNIDYLGLLTVFNNLEEAIWHLVEGVHTGWLRSASRKAAELRHDRLAYHEYYLRESQMASQQTQSAQQRNRFLSDTFGYEWGGYVVCTKDGYVVSFTTDHSHSSVRLQNALIHVVQRYGRTGYMIMVSAHSHPNFSSLVPGLGLPSNEDREATRDIPLNIIVEPDKHITYWLGDRL